MNLKNSEFSKIFQLSLSVTYNRMMKCSIRRFVFVLLVAITFQGIASTPMFACEMGHGLAVSDNSLGSQVIFHDHTDSSQMAHSSSDEHSPSDSIKVSVNFDGHSFDSDPHKNHLKHNTCGSSDASGVIADDILFLANPVSNSSVFTYISSLHLPPVLAGLDRPPR